MYFADHNRMNLPEDIWILIFSYLDPSSLWICMLVSKLWAQYIGRSGRLMLRYELAITPEKFKILSVADELLEIPFRNLSVKSFKRAEQLRKFSKIIKKFKNSVEILEIHDFRRSSIKEVTEFFSGFSKLRVLRIMNCQISEEVDNQILKPVQSLKELYFEISDGNFFKIFRRQEFIFKITVRNPDWTWNGFSHEGFNELVKTLPNLDFIKMDGTGTGSYFDCDEFPYKIRKLETSMITFHWYVAIRTARKNFLEAQKANLKELTIHNLPYDFDGEQVLRFIVEQMELDRFYYGNIPLIYDGQKQPVREFMANEIQICCLYEMFRQFPTITSFKLLLTQTDIDSSEIERVINPRTELFNNVQNFEVLDQSGYRRIFGVFLGLFKNFRNISSLKLQSLDRNINVLLQEFLPLMTNLKEIYIDSKAPRVEERFNIIRVNVPGLRKLWVDAEYSQQAKNFFGNDVEILETEIHSYP